MFKFGDTILGIKLEEVQRQLLLDQIWHEVFSDEQFKETILNWIRNDQLFEKGIDENGDVIGYYSFVSEVINPDKMEGTPYTLYDSGEFYRSMFITVMMDATFVIDADAIKVDENGTEDLFQKYGDGIIGLAEESREKLAIECIERFNNVAREILQWN
jgi:hypothetical protein